MSTQSDCPELAQSTVGLSHPFVHSCHLVYFVFTTLFIYYMQSIIVIMLFFLQNASPPFKRVSVGSVDFESLCLEKTSCSFSRLFL